MTVSLTVGNISDELGSASFLHSFFSTICVRCEDDNWGSKFPHLMNDLYQGKLETEQVNGALAELHEVKVLLSKFPPSQVVWDIESRSVAPPWGDDIAPTITDLGNYFVTSTGRDLIDTMAEALEEAIERKIGAVIE